MFYYRYLYNSEKGVLLKLLNDVRVFLKLFYFLFMDHSENSVLVNFFCE